MKKLLFVLSICFCIYLNVNYVIGQDDSETTTTTESVYSTTNATANKNRKVNWTEVEEKWMQVLDDDVVHEKWKKLDENLKNGNLEKDKNLKKNFFNSIFFSFSKQALNQCLEQSFRKLFQ